MQLVFSAAICFFFGHMKSYTPCIVGVNSCVKNCWELPCLLKFGQLARMVVWVTSMHSRRVAKLTYRKEQDGGQNKKWRSKFNKFAYLGLQLA